MDVRQVRGFEVKVTNYKNGSACTDIPPVLYSAVFPETSQRFFPTCDNTACDKWGSKFSMPEMLKKLHGRKRTPIGSKLRV